MNTGQDILILFSMDQKDDAPVAPEWILKFSWYLNTIIGRILDRKPTIKLNSDIHADADKTDIYAHTNVFIIIINPGDFRDKNFVKDLDLARKMLDSQGSSYRRLFKIIRSPLKEEDIPDWLNRNIAYNFFQNASGRRRVETFSTFDNIESKHVPIWNRLIDLAYDVSIVLTQNVKELYKSETPKKVFLAETTPDQYENREALRRELLLRGINIEPVYNLPENHEKIRSIMFNELKDSGACIHIMGNEYGQYLANSQHSLIDWQTKISKEFLQQNPNTQLQRVIWIPPVLKISDPRQELYLNRLNRNEDKKNTEIFRSPLERLKDYLYKLLTTNQQGKQDEAAAARKMVYYLHDGLFTENADVAEQICIGKGIHFIQFYPEKSQNPVRDHIHNLVKANAVLIEYNNNPVWLQTKMNEIIKAKGYGKTHDFKFIAIIANQQDDYLKQIGNKYPVIQKELLTEKLSGLITA